MIDIKICGNKITASNLCPLTEGNVNSLFAALTYSPEWDEFLKTAVFSNGNVSISLPLPTASFAIPWEVLAEPGKLYVAVRGAGNNGNVVLCTNNLFLGYVRSSLAAWVAQEHREATPDVIDALVATSAEHEQRIDELAQGGGGVGVEDVTVDGVSVVVDGVAEIDLSDYALKDELDEYLQPDDLYTSTLYPDFTNQLPIATDEDGEIYNGIGYKPYALLNSDGTVSDTSAGLVTSGFIPISNNAVIRLDGFELPNGSGSSKVVTYDASFGKIQSGASGTLADNYYFGNAVIEDDNVVQFSISHQSAAAYMRICTKLSMISDNPIITVNEEITYSETGKKFLPEVRLDYSQLDNVPDTRKVYTPISPMEHLSIAYSSIGRKPINTIEHFVDCCENYGFNALKADVRPTSDGELICCHDAGFTFDGNGKITTYDATNATMIHNVTAATCVGYSFPTGEHPCTVGDYLNVCRKYGKVAFITIRDQYMDVVIPKLISEIKHRSMQNAVIINSMTYASLIKWREVEEKIAMNYTLDRGANVTSAEIDKAVALGNCSLNAFGFGGSSTTSDVTCDFAYAASKGVRLLNAICYVSGSYENALAEGYDGAQIGYPWGKSISAQIDARLNALDGNGVSY